MSKPANLRKRPGSPPSPKMFQTPMAERLSQLPQVPTDSAQKRKRLLKGIVKRSKLDGWSITGEAYTIAL